MPGHEGARRRLGLLRVLIITAVVFLGYLLVRMLLKSMQQSGRRRPEVIMPYCQKCESNRNVVVNSGQAEDYHLRWWCTRCKEGF